MLFFDVQASGDYIGMAIKNNVLICVYKLGGVVHEVETSQITTTTDVNSSNFDRVIFHRYSIHVTQVWKVSTDFPNFLSGKYSPHSFLLQQV